MASSQVNQVNNLLGAPNSQIPPDQLQFLDWDDFQRYILILVDQSGYLTNDIDYLPAFHQRHLTKHKSDSKKDSGYAQPLIRLIISLTTLLASNTE